MGELVCADGTIIQISEEKEAELRAASGPKPKLEFGDIVKCEFGRRVLLYDQYGRLRICYPYSNGDVHIDITELGFYEPTGENIFKDNLLHLNH